VINSTPLLLFYKFPRVLATYSRRFGVRRIMVNNFKQIQNIVDTYNGYRHIWIGLYDINYVIDKVWIDIDAPSFEKAFEDAKKLVNKLNKYDMPYIPIFSGGKGFHIYVLFKPWTSPNIETAKIVVRNIQEQLCDGIKHIDKHGFGNIGTLTRYPNTKRPDTKLWCIPLPKDFYKYNISDIVKLSKKPNYITYYINELKDIREFVDIDYIYNNKDIGLSSPFKTNSHPISNDIYTYLSFIIRPCIVKYLMDEREPLHDIRVDLVAELYYLGYSKEDIFNIIKKLNWSDFDENITKYQINHVIDKGYKPLSCSRIKSLIPKYCDNCGWWYFWD